MGSRGADGSGSADRRVVENFTGWGDMERWCGTNMERDSSGDRVVDSKEECSSLRRGETSKFGNCHGISWLGHCGCG